MVRQCRTMNSIQVKDKMSSPVETIDYAGKSIKDAAVLMNRKSIGSLIVMENGIASMITERDILKALAENNQNALVTDYSKKPIVTINENAFLGDAAQMMLTNHIRRLVVVDDRGKISGIINIRDVTNAVHDAFLSLFEIS